MNEAVALTASNNDTNSRSSTSVDSHSNTSKSTESALALHTRDGSAAVSNNRISAERDNAVEKTSEIDVKQYQFEALLKSKGNMNGDNVEAVLTSDNYLSLVDKLAAENKSDATIEFEREMQAEALAQGSELSDYRIACNDNICLGYFQSYEPAALDSFIENFTMSSDGVMANIGTVFKHKLTDSDNGSSSYRLTFSRGNTIESITFATK